MKTITPSPEQMEALIARFPDAKAAYGHVGPADLSAEAAKEMFPNAAYPVLGPADAETAVVKFFRHGPEGIAYYILECDPGSGSALHAHHCTEEIFTVLEGSFRIQWGDKGEHSVTLDRWDTISVPQKVVRRFVNETDKVAYLLAVITGASELLNEFEYTPEVGERLKAVGGQATYDLMCAAGVTFSAGLDVGEVGNVDKASTHPRVV